MAAPAWYNEADQEIFKDNKFITQEKYRLGPYTPPVQGGGQDASTPSFGIPATDAFTNSDGGYNPYMPNTSLNTTYRPNYDYRKSLDYNPELSDLQNQKIMQGMPNFKGYDYYNKPDPTGVEKLLGQAINYVPYIGTIKRGAEFLGNALQGVMPINRRAIMENELRGGGIYTDDIGRIAIGQGGTYNTPEGIMAGYNANQMTDKTFDKRTDNMRETLTGKYGLTDQQVDGLISGELDEDDFTGSQYQLPSGKISNIFSNIRNVELSKQMFKNKKNESDKIYEFEKKRKEEEKLAKQGKIRLGSNLVQDTTYRSDPALSREGRENYTGKGMAFEKQSGGVTGKGTANERNYGGRKDGGRAGYFFGGRAGFAKGGKGRQDPMGGHAHQTAQEMREAAPDQFGGGMNINQGSDNTGGITEIITNNAGGSNLIDTSNIKSMSPEVSFNYTPAEWAVIRGRIFNTNLEDNDNIETEANISGDLGNFNYDINLDQEGNKNYNLGYENNIKGYDLAANTDLNNTNFSVGKNGYNVTGSTGEGGNNIGLSKTWSWGQEPQKTINRTSYKQENPDLIYGQNLRYGGLASIL